MTNNVYIAWNRKPDVIDDRPFDIKWREIEEVNKAWAQEVGWLTVPPQMLSTHENDTSKT